MGRGQGRQVPETSVVAARCVRIPRCRGYGHGFVRRETAPVGVIEETVQVITSV